MSSRSIAVIGGGVTGLAAAYELATATHADVTVFEADERLGGRIAGAGFAGVDHVDTAADSFLARVPDAVALATEVGLAGELVSPEPVGAAVWHHGLYPIPDGLMLGLPGRLRPLAATGLLSWRGKARAAIEPLLPRTSIDDDSIGALVRARFGDEVHERLVDALVGSIYAADTDRFSLREVPQLHDIAEHSRSLLIGARRRAAAGTATAASSPVFAAPRGGLPQLIDATASATERAGGTIRLATAIETIEPVDAHWRLVGGSGDGSGDGLFDAVILATPAQVSARLLRRSAPSATRLLSTAEVADVVMITLHVPASEWPERLRGLSGYLVPKPVQRSVTAASFGSQKWAHWRPPAGGEILRVSVGRDGIASLERTDDDLVAAVLDDLREHLGTSFTPMETRVSRWPGAFAQYRPHHHRWVDAVEAALPNGVFVAGSSYRGIGVPACIRDGRASARRSVRTLEGLYP